MWLHFAFLCRSKDWSTAVNVECPLADGAHSFVILSCVDRVVDGALLFPRIYPYMRFGLAEVNLFPQLTHPANVITWCVIAQDLVLAATIDSSGVRLLHIRVDGTRQHLTSFCTSAQPLSWNRRQRSHHEICNCVRFFDKHCVRLLNRHGTKWCPDCQRESSA